MQSTVKQSNKRKAFSIVELLTVMSIIVILFSLLMPALSMARRYAKKVRQNAQFHAIAAGLELFAKPVAEGGDGEFPESAAFGYDQTGTWGSYDYCGAMKLAEALVGQDLLGFNPQSLFNNTGTTFTGTSLYPDQYSTPQVPPPPPPPYPAWYVRNLKSRKLNLDIRGANVHTLGEIYGVGGYGGNRGSFGNLGDPDDPNGGIVLCDVYTRVRNKITGERIGMPILYYKADTTRHSHEWLGVGEGLNDQNIYNYDDNVELVKLPLPFNPGAFHPMATAGSDKNGDPVDPTIFYRKMTRDRSVTVINRPVKPDSYILISAGFDGEYGTEDDVYSFRR